MKQTSPIIYYCNLTFFVISFCLLLFYFLLFVTNIIQIHVADFSFFIGLICVTSISVLATIFIYFSLKKKMVAFETYELAAIFNERQEAFNVMHEGVIAIDHHFNITIFNEKARSILGVKTSCNENLGKSIFDVLPDTRLPEIVMTESPVYNQEIFVNNHSIMSTRIPIKVDDRTLGAIAVFKDLTEVKKMAEELTGVKAFVEALRVQTHEYKNKLHTIAGLLQLGHTEQALSYLSQVQTNHETLTSFLTERIMNESISGLILSKIIRGQELGIQVRLDEQFHFTKFPAQLDHHDFVILLGNLIENAFEAFDGLDREEKEIFISIDDHEDLLAILVSDNGVGIEDENIVRIFDNGYSTKGKDNSGIGLFLLKEIITKGNGTIDIQSEKNKGTTFIITFDL